MHVNKRIGRFKQWAGERMGGEIKTNATDDFKAMETEMGVRHEGKRSNILSFEIEKKTANSGGPLQALIAFTSL